METSRVIQRRLANGHLPLGKVNVAADLKHIFSFSLSLCLYNRNTNKAFYDLEALATLPVVATLVITPV